MHPRQDLTRHPLVPLLLQAGLAVSTAAHPLGQHDLTLFIELTGDQAAFPADSRRMTRALRRRGSHPATVRGLHFGGPIEQAGASPPGNELAAAEIIAWLAKRHELTPPA